MRVRAIPAVAGGAAGLLGAAAAAGVARQRRAVASDRAQITPRSAAALHDQPVDRERRLRTDDGVTLHAEEVGPPDAPLTVLLVHGYALSLQSFVLQRKAIRDQFGDRVRIVQYDQRSHGRSGRAPATACTIEQLGRDLGRVIDELVPSGPLVLVGHSMGGMTIMALAEQHPELFRDRVRAVALVNTSSGELRTVTLGLPSLLARLRGPVLRGAARNVALVERGRALGKDLAWVITKRLSFADPDVPPAVVAFSTNLIAGTPVDVVADFYPTLMAHDGREGLRGLSHCEVLVIGAENDLMTPLSHSEALAAALPHARLVVAPRSGHLLMLEHPDLVNRPLLELIESAYPAKAKSSARARSSRRAQSKGAVQR